MFDVIGESYGEGDGSTTFNLPALGDPNGGWVEIADVQDLQSHSGDLEPTKWEIPSWFANAEINQYLWIDEGSILDYAAGSG